MTTTKARPKRTRPAPSRAEPKDTSLSTGLLNEIKELLGQQTVALMKQGEQIESLAQRVEVVETGRPQFVPLRREKRPDEELANTYVPPEQIMKRAMKGMERDGDTAAGRRSAVEIPSHMQQIPPQYRPAFRSGDAVRINPYADIHGAEGRKWSEVLNARQADGIGEVMSIQYMTKTWEPKYTVYIKGITQKDGDGFRESELLPA